MTNASASNASPSDTALPTVPQQTRQYNTTDEGLFLTQQATDAKAAVRRTLADMKVTAQEVADVRWWTQQYPWYAVGTAAVVGFIAATRVLTPADHHAETAPPPQAQPAASPSLTSALFEMLRSTVVSTIIGALHSSSSSSQTAKRTPATQMEDPP